MDWDCLVGCQGAQSQKEGQKNPGEVTELRWYLFLGPLSLPPGALGSLAIHQAIQKPLRGR